MRRTLFRWMAALEILAALVLLYMVWILPGTQEIRDRAQRVENVARNTSSEVNNLQARMALVSARQPHLRQLAEQMEKQTALLTEQLRTYRVNFATVETIGRALGEVAEGVEGMREVLAPEGIAQLDDALRSTADYLEKKVAPAAEKAADQLDKAVAVMREDALRFRKLVKDAPLDLRAAREVEASLGKLTEGIDQVGVMLKMPNLQTMKEGFKGLETALSTGASQVDRLAGYSYPSVRFEGLRPQVEQKPFWPEGGDIAEGMRKASKGAVAAGKELETLTKELPALRTSLEESRRAADRTRQMLAAAIKQQDVIEPVLKNIPEHAARLAEQLPQLGGDLAQVLRETAQLRETGRLLREAEAGILKAQATWPQLNASLKKSAAVLRATQTQLDRALAQRASYEAALGQTVQLAEAFSRALPLFSDYVHADLNDQVESLGKLRHSVDEVAEVIPEAADSATRLVGAARLLLALVALIFAMHGAWMFTGFPQKEAAHGNQDGSGRAD